MNRLARLSGALCAATLLAPGAAAARYHQADFPAEEFRARHAQVFATEGFTLPRQHNSFY